MSDYECPKCRTEYEASGIHEDDAGEQQCGNCGFKFIVTIEYEPEYSTDCVEHQYGESKPVLHTNAVARFCQYCGACDPDSVRTGCEQ